MPPARCQKVTSPDRSLWNSGRVLWRHGRLQWQWNVLDSRGDICCVRLSLERQQQHHCHLSTVNCEHLTSADSVIPTHGFQVCGVRMRQFLQRTTRIRTQISSKLGQTASLGMGEICMPDSGKVAVDRQLSRVQRPLCRNWFCQPNAVRNGPSWLVDPEINCRAERVPDQQSQRRCRCRPISRPIRVSAADTPTGTAHSISCS